MSERIIFGHDPSRRYRREWQGHISGKWWFAASYRTRFMAVFVAFFARLEAPQRVIDTKGGNENA